MKSCPFKISILSDVLAAANSVRVEIRPEEILEVRVPLEIYLSQIDLIT